MKVMEQLARQLANQVMWMQRNQHAAERYARWAKKHQDDGDVEKAKRYRARCSLSLRNAHKNEARVRELKWAVEALTAAYREEAA